MPELSSPEGINSLVSDRESTESIAFPVMKKASEAPQSPNILIPIVSGRVFEPSFRRTEAEATMYNKIAWPELRQMQKLSNDRDEIWQYQDRDTGQFLRVRAEDVRKGKEAYEASRQTTSIVG